MIIGVDFDGTIVKHEYPSVGVAVPHALRVMKRLITSGHQLILWTMRSELEPEYGSDENPLVDATAYLHQNGIPLFGVNRNPEQDEWTSSPKAYCQYYIDDAAIGCPLIYEGGDMMQRPYVDWLAVEQYLFYRGFFRDVEPTKSPDNQGDN